MAHAPHLAPRHRHAPSTAIIPPVQGEFCRQCQGGWQLYVFLLHATPSRVRHRRGLYNVGRNGKGSHAHGALPASEPAWNAPDMTRLYLQALDLTTAAAAAAAAVLAAGGAAQVLTASCTSRAGADPVASADAPGRRRTDGLAAEEVILHGEVVEGQASEYEALGGHRRGCAAESRGR